MQLATRIRQLLSALCYGLYEKDEVMRLTLLSALAGESIFLLGKPGVAKSLVARRLKYAFHQGKAFEYLMSRFSTPDELFGPVSVAKLKDADRYERVTRGYLPEADIVFLDEIWKAGPSIQNALLTILNEKVYKNGDTELQAPIKAIISASNELPAQGEGLEALWDRFLLRYIVQPIRQKNSFNAMIADTHSAYSDRVDIALKITETEYAEWSKAIDGVEIPDEIFSVIHAIRHYLNEYNEQAKAIEWYISDRRWRKIVRLLRASAFFNGRYKVDLSDCFLIAYCIWELPEQEQIAQEMVAQAIEKHGYIDSDRLQEIKKLLRLWQEEVVKGCLEEKRVNVETPRLFNGKYYGFKMNNEFYEIDEQHYLQLRPVQQTITLHVYWGLVQKFAMKSQLPNHIAIFDEYSPKRDYKLETQLESRVQQVPAPPAPATEREWDARARRLGELLESLKTQLENELQQKSDARNLFVQPAAATSIQKNLQQTLTQIEQLKLDIKQTIYSYKKLKQEAENRLEQHQKNTKENLWEQFLKKDKRISDLLDLFL